MSNSYIINSYRVIEVVKNYVYALLVDYNIETKEFFVHALFNTAYSINKDNQGWVPVCWELITKTWGRDKVNWHLLVETGLIEVKVLGVVEISSEITKTKTYSRSQSLSREFRVPTRILADIKSLEPSYLDEVSYFNLVTGRKMNTFKRHELYTAVNNPIPNLLKSSMLCIEKCVINAAALEDYFKTLEVNLTGKSTDCKEYRRYLNDKHCYSSILATGAKHIGNGFVEYYPGYRPQMSGRISEISGGVQSCTREMRAIAFKDVPEIHNYDLQSSQVWSLIQFFELAGLDISWLTNYLQVDKQIYANRVGITKATWKNCFLALIMGGILLAISEVSKIKKFEDVDTAILKYLTEELVDDKAIMESYLKFFTVVEPLKIVIDKWHTWLLKRYIFLNMDILGGKLFIYNKSGIHFPIWEYKKPNADIYKDKQPWKEVSKLKRQLAAFYLQGNEATFIHQITLLGKEYGYEVYGNAHDGLITKGKIPEEAVVVAKELSGLNYAFLVEKPFND